MGAALKSQDYQRAVPVELSRSPQEARLARPPAPSALRAPQRQPRESRLPSRAVAPQPRQRAVVRSLPTRSTPPWLRLLIVAQRSSGWFTMILVAAVLGVYGWTVFSQQLGSQQYDKLQELQRSERDLTSANEMLKQQMANQAEAPGSTLRLPGADTNLFLRPAPLRPSNPVADPTPALDPLSVDRAVGY